MMAFTVDQLEWLKARAIVMANTIKSREEHGYTPEMHAAFIEGHLREVCEMGAGIEWARVSSSPWEYAFQGYKESADENEEHADAFAAGGWELQFVTSYWMLWRRRKAVSDDGE